MKVYDLDIWQYSIIQHPTKTKLKGFKTRGKIKGKELSNNTDETSLNRLDCSVMLTIFNNTPYFSGSAETKEMNIPPRVDDILHGVCRLDMGGNSRPLNKVKLYDLITLKDVLYLPDIERHLNVQLRQAQRWMKACKIAVRAIEREYKLRTIDILPQFEY